MPEPTEEFRQKLLSVQEMSPPLRNAYQRELDGLLNPPLKAGPRVVGMVLFIGCLVLIALIARADIIYHVRGLALVAHMALGAALLWASVLIVRDLRRRTHSLKSVYSLAMVFTWAAGTMTVVALLLGLGHQSDPKSLYGAFYVFVFYFACAVWGLETRIASAELAAREQSLRIECRLADLAERLQK